jgi:hypothetical protein
VRKSVLHVMLLSLLVLTFHDHLIANHSHIDASDTSYLTLQDALDEVQLHEQMHSLSYFLDHNTLLSAVVPLKEQIFLQVCVYDYFTCSPPYRPPISLAPYFKFKKII